MDEPAIPNRRETLVALGLCAFAYLYVFPYQNKLNNPNENVRFYMTAAIVEEQRYEIDAMRARWGWVNDAAKYEGHLYSVKAPGTSLLGVPGYAAYLGATRLLGREFDRTQALWVCRVTASVLPTLFFLFFFHRFLGTRTRHPLLRDYAFFAVALGSLLYGYALLFVSHTLSAACAFASMMLLLRLRSGSRPDPRSAFAAGLTCAGVTLFEYPGLLASVVLAGYGCLLLRRSRALLWFAAGGSLPTLAVMHFQYRAFGHPLRPGHLFVETKALRQQHHEGLYGATLPSWEAFYGLVLDLGAGLFPLTAFLLFAPVGIAMAWKRGNRSELIAGLLLCGLTTLAICAMNNWRGGWTIGPRYLALLVPFIALWALEGAGWLAERSAALVYATALGLTALSLLASGLPSAYYPHLPPEFTRPLPQLFAVLVAHGYAPHNAGNLLGIYGSWSMLPLLLCFSGALAWPIWQVPGEARAKALLAVGGLILGLCLSAPMLVRPEHEPGVAGAVAFVTRRWSPTGHDRASRLVSRLQRQPAVHDHELQALAELYALEGRAREARRARQGHLR